LKKKQSFLGHSSIGNFIAHKPKMMKGAPTFLVSNPEWLREADLNHQPLGLELAKTT
jgi:hypothetical protein